MTELLHFHTFTHFKSIILTILEELKQFKLSNSTKMKSGIAIKLFHLNQSFLILLQYFQPRHSAETLLGPRSKKEKELPCPLYTSII